VKYDITTLLLFGIVVSGCATAVIATAPVAEEAVEDRRECPRVAYFGDEAALRAQLPRLYEEHQRELIVLGTAVYVNNCARNARLAGAGEDSRLAGAGEDSRLAGAGEDSRLAGAGEDSRLAGAGEDSRLAGAGEDSRLAGAGEDSRLAGAGEDSRLAGATRPLTCTMEKNALGYAIHPHTQITVRIYDGIALWRIKGDELVPE
jgi:hypothetical protein